MKIKRFQMGGAVAPEQGGAPMPAGGPEAGGAPMGPEGGAPGGAPEGGEDPIMQLVQMAMQALQSQDPQMAMAVCDGLVQLVQGVGGAPAPGGAPEEPVMMRKGGKMIAKKGAKMTKKRC